MKDYGDEEIGAIGNTHHTLQKIDQRLISLMHVIPTIPGNPNRSSYA